MELIGTKSKLITIWAKLIVIGLLAACCGLGVWEAAGAESPGALTRIPPIDPRTYVFATNQYISLAVVHTSGQMGQYVVWATDGRSILSNPPIDVGFTTLRVDGEDLRLGNSSDGQTTVQPLVQGQSIYFVWESYGKTSKEIEIRVEQKLTLVRDSIRFDYTLTNVGSEAHLVGFRVVQDTDLGLTAGGYFVIPGGGLVTTETEYTQAQHNMPDYWLAVDDPRSPSIVALAALTGSGATLPDRLAIVDSGGAVGQIFAWDHQITPGRDITQTAAVLQYWREITLRPGQKRHIVTYCGLGYASSQFSDPYVLATQSPFSLSVVTGDNPVTPEVEQYYYQPDPFTIHAYIYNVTGYAATDAMVHLTLPRGLTLAAGETSSKTIGRIAAWSEGSASWQVKPTGEALGKLTYGILGSVSPGGSKSASRGIDIPSIPSHFVRVSATKKVAMISVPYSFVDADPGVALGIPPNLLQLARYNPNRPPYSYYPHPWVSQVTAGYGYWLKLDSDQQINLVGASPIDQSTSYSVLLEEGWNQMGNPYLSDIWWGTVEVLYNNQTYSIEQAAASGIIRPTVYWYDIDREEYVLSSAPTTYLPPWRGFWVKAMKPCYLMFKPKPLPFLGPSRSLPADSRSSTPSLNQWRVQLCARADKVSDLNNYWGVSPEARDGYDLQDLDEPPVIAPYLSLRFTHPEWGENRGNYLQDMRAAGASQTWDFEVITDQRNIDLVLSWPDLGRVPKEIGFVLIDLDGNRSCYMRTSSSYTFNSGSQEASRHFRIVAEPSSGGYLRISQIQCVSNRGRGVTISYATTRDAMTQVMVRTPAGKLVRVVARSRASRAAMNTVVWDGRDQSGRLAPQGPYVCEVTARAEDGQSARGIRVFSLVR